MKITITSEFTGPDAISTFVNQLACSELKIAADEKNVQTLVQNKDGKWIDFDPTKIRFVYTK